MKLGTVLPHLKIQKMNKSLDTPLEFCWYQDFYQKMGISVILGNILKLHFYTFFFNSFHLYSVVIGVFKQHGCYFVHAINIGHSRPSWHRGILKSMLWLALHDFCPWFHHQNFITWFKLYSRCFHVTKVSNFSISTREVIITSFLWEFDHWFFWGVVLVQVR